jgi:hypothetical protein
MPEIPSKMRSFFEDAHGKLSNFESRRARSPVPAGWQGLSRTCRRLETGLFVLQPHL